MGRVWRLDFGDICAGIKERLVRHWPRVKNVKEAPKDSVSR